MKEIKASIDLGDNITKLIEQLAHQIGVTADKVFPWYVQQAVIEGYVTVVSIILGLILGIAASFYYVKKLSNAEDNSKEEAVFYPASAISGAFFFFMFVAFLMTFQESFTKIINPEYHAFKTIVSDVSRLSGR